MAFLSSSRSCFEDLSCMSSERSWSIWSLLRDTRSVIISALLFSSSSSNSKRFNLSWRRQGREQHYTMYKKKAVGTSHIHKLHQLSVGFYSCTDTEWRFLYAFVLSSQAVKRLMNCHAPFRSYSDGKTLWLCRPIALSLSFSFSGRYTKPRGPHIVCWSTRSNKDTVISAEQGFLSVIGLTNTCS